MSQVFCKLDECNLYVQGFHLFYIHRKNVHILLYKVYKNKNIFEITVNLIRKDTEKKKQRNNYIKVDMINLKKILLLCLRCISKINKSCTNKYINKCTKHTLFTRSPKKESSLLIDM